ncbi:hypothetical protein K1T71_009447 [Dendrolimus kikuchii]|uniref:Uncharacterized protein n=1 Tax=Dendrolimus kikuchii TaxID=765133 RepID=A0ACC1CUG5_9NEOP|nr:hypothetical protein K1T71_009447 [Dendrolimus kikuchii]
MVRVAIIGAGINGLSCALRIKKKYSNFEVVVISDKFSPDTTGDGSGGLWYPYLVGSTPEQKIAKWGCETYRFLHQLWLEGGHDVCLMPVYVLSGSQTGPRPIWADNVFGYKELEEEELKYLSQLYSASYVSGHKLTTFVSTAPSLLSYLQKSFVSLNGVMKKSKISSLRDPLLEEYDVIINCTGIGARFLVPDDNVFPIRGQIVKVNAPWIRETILDDQGNYIIPNAKSCILGGTHQENDWNTNEDPKDTEFILNRCRQMIPALEHADIIEHWTGLRPGRNEVRLESEVIDGKVYIHNYGHGGSGLTLFWGCASDVLELLDIYLLGRVQSKL